ncbi:low molecular weight phosphotyrosine protein phosphatase [Massilia sp. Dwa41.01b]|uniref:low molecular weight protein-tyrosine-phosphatase n=1 Tax=unclassified Massilia TaxID=2609279 RepID=UPI001601165F|nr:MULTISPECIES: low molecular weight protein-tyrosine-phosphatase [unclassified Massilia]QNA89676.1 low molecular weight phosphotyrosine protein phosphatase [Massilia sp. Dwa41.01b]QNB00571.1 low molecular weight phosphotyrosine protein phosphatase [Massilia sp. Se16.2.3]
MNNILVVCIGNICRSPMAEAYLQAKLPGSRVTSSGVGALEGRSADPNAVQLMSEELIDIRGHVARQISVLDVSQADLILVMDKEQKRWIESRFTSARGKVFRICEQQEIDVPDPYREGIESFRHALQLIKIGADVWAKNIKKMS